MSDLHPSICLSDYVKEIKVASSWWMQASENFLAFEGWQVVKVEYFRSVGKVCTMRQF
jgi:hypothetical protein